MTNAILLGKPITGNPHVRFGEGEVASARSRRWSLLCKKLFVIVILITTQQTQAGLLEHIVMSVVSGAVGAAARKDKTCDKILDDTELSSLQKRILQLDSAMKTNTMQSFLGIPLDSTYDEIDNRNGEKQIFCDSSGNLLADLTGEMFFANPFRGFKDVKLEFTENRGVKYLSEVNMQKYYLDKDEAEVEIEYLSKLFCKKYQLSQANSTTGEGKKLSGCQVTQRAISVFIRSEEGGRKFWITIKVQSGLPRMRKDEFAARIAAHERLKKEAEERAKEERARQEKINVLKARREESASEDLDALDR